MLVDSVPIEKPGNERSERAAMREAEKLRTRHSVPCSTGGSRNTRCLFRAEMMRLRGIKPRLDPMP